VSRLFRVASLALVIVVAASQGAAQFPPAPGTGPGLPETIEAIDAARVTTRILYITAHPDDESAAVLTYLARGLHADVALLSLTRGEGGQNALGPEQAPQLGLIRTQELLAATRGYGVKLYFTRAQDFGYSKTSTETEKIWGDQVLEDMVRVIRAFRPNIVINHWGGVHSGHGHHQAAGLITPKAVQSAGEESAYPQLSKEGLPPWAPDGNPPLILDLERGSEAPSGFVLPLDEVSPLYGKTWREIGIDAFANHRTQGITAFLNSPFIRRSIALKREDGKPFDPKDLARVIGDENCPVAGEVGKDLQVARNEALTLNFDAAARSIAKAASEKSLVCNRDISLGPGGMKTDNTALDEALRRKRIERALELAAGLEIRADSDRSEVIAGEAFDVTTSARCRSTVSCVLSDPVLQLPKGWTFTGEKTLQGAAHKFSIVAVADNEKLPIIATLSGEAWPLAQVRQPVTVDGYSFTAQTPVAHTEVSSTTVERVSLRLVPAYTLAVEPQQVVEVLGQNRKPLDVLLRVHSYSAKAAKVSVGLDAPDGLKTAPPAELAFDGVGDLYVKLTVASPARLEAGNYSVGAYAKLGERKFTTSLEALSSLPTILWSEPAQCIIHAFDIAVPPNLHVGYISAEGEPIPDALKRLGISVEMLDASALAFGDLAKYDAIVAGVRAYELRPELPEANKRLLDYVSNGGTLVVQYNRDFVWDKLQPAPYPARIGSPTPRITDEKAEVRFLKPADHLLNWPNKITAADFQNWVQERGLYFWSDFDAKYTPLLAMNDPGEKDLNGALVYANYGTGRYIYTGLAFFREIPEGVPGAYRLFVNLLSASRVK